ncbi:hypothetical protein OPU71_16955 [Niveibacterium sp. 24ML]|uniref:hypothetical protein n=1 Tax=Niveibacterium sp. 24ML TaxID=2985512 RepID=UPI002270A69F|nr:hypothetical protein [Niveibacterium sp. 24ML]MCX9157815.1 hypothetical protein [Niveibacterium sp. 24ML]
MSDPNTSSHRPTPSLAELQERAAALEKQLGGAIPHFCDKSYVERKAAECPAPDRDERVRVATYALCNYYESLLALRERDSSTWNALTSWN